MLCNNWPDFSATKEQNQLMRETNASLTASTNWKCAQALTQPARTRQESNVQLKRL